MTKRSCWWKVVPVVLVFVAVQGFLLSLDLERKGWEQIESVFPDRGVPRINITLNGVSLDEINKGSKDTKYEGNELTLYNGRSKREFDDVEVKGRGNTTWLQEKKPYQIKFTHKVDLLGMGKTKKWVLLANSLDDTNLRNDIAMMLAEMVGMQYNHRGRFVELYVDDEYIGLYYALQKVEISKGSVDLKRDDGLLFELDMLHRGNEDSYETYLGEHLVIKDSVLGVTEKNNEIIKSFISDFNEGEKAIEMKNIERVKEIIDLESFAKYFLINEFTVNPDAYSTSFYLYRDNNGKIAAGPVWDFDLAFGNRVWTWWTDESFFSPTESMVRKKDVFKYDDSEGDRKISKILYYLMDIPEFRETVVALYRETLFGQKRRITKEIADIKEQLDEAREIDGEKWNKAGFKKEYEDMIEWIEARFNYFEELYGEKTWGRF